MAQSYRSIILIIAICTTCLPGNAEYFKHVSLNEGLSQPSVLTINQDALGRMWFGTREGINIYDGNSIVTHKGWVTNAQAGDSVWIGNEVRAIVKDARDNMFCLIDDDIIKYDIVTEQFSHLTSNKKIQALHSHNGTISIVGINALFTKMENSDSLRMEFTVPSLPTVTFLSVTDSIYYISTTDGLYALNRNSGDITVHAPGTDIYSTFIDHDGNVWICAQSGGLYRMKTGQEPELMSLPVITDNRLGAQQTREAIEDEYGNIWYGTFSGLFCFDPVTRNARRIELPTSLGGLTHPSIFALYRDDNGTIWTGSYYGGVNYFTPKHDDFINYNYDGHAPSGMYHSYIIDMTVDKAGNLWFGTDGAGVCCVDSTWNILEQLTSQSSGKALRQNNIKALAYDQAHNRLYIGTHLGGLSCFDINTGHIRNFINEAGPKDMLGDIIHHLKIHNDTLYISSRKGMFCLDLVSQYITRITPEIPYAHKFDISPNGDIYVHSPKKITKIDRSTGKEQILRQCGDLNGRTNVLCTDSGVYFTSLGNGLFVYNPVSATLRNYTSSNSSLPSDYCYNLCADKDGNIIILTDRDVVRHNPRNESFQTIRFSNLFPESRIISECGLSVTPDGTILIGSTKGITALHPSKFSTSPIQASSKSNFYFSRLSIQNEAIYPNDNSGVLDRALPYTNEITLSPDQTTFSIHLTLSDYINPQNFHKFQYRMDGIDHSWLTSDDGDIHYTNINPGHYTLRARYSPDGIIPGSDEIKLRITVNQPWYTSWWAYLCYLLCVSVAAIMVINNRKSRMQLHSAIEKERFEKHQIEKLNHEKLVFFTNVSHEFQTPLTLIISHIDLLASKYSHNAPLRDALKRIRGHAAQMSHLITQLLEFRKIQQNHQAFHVARHNAATTLAEVATPFVAYAAQRNIKFSITNPEATITGYYDADMMSKVLVNLISNAFKYTPDGGQISVSASQRPDGAIIFNVSDTGRGIAPKDINHIFDRFYNGSADESIGLNYKSTGIGLAFAKSIVDKHQGTITVDSIHGEGSTFTVTIPASADVFANDPNATVNDSPYIKTASQEQVEPISDDTIAATDADDADEPDAALPLILIVEDNAELSHNLKLFFSQYYRVETASNGREALDIISEINPDIIISDIMMPEMSGTEMCRTIKSDLNLCHIPVILLTALNSTEHTLDGLNANADDYMTKPFDTRVLLARVDNLLRNRRILQKQFDRRPISEIDLTVINPLDRDLLKRTSEIIDKHISNSELDIPLLCRELSISRSLFYNKFKALTGMTPNTFILNYRLKHAATMLETNPHISISEVSDHAGFSTTMYFSRCFKKQFGVPPQQYQKNAFNRKQAEE